MHRLGARLLKLEAKSKGSPIDTLPVGVASAPIAGGKLEPWARTLLAELDAPANCQLTVVEGEREMIVPWTPLAWLRGEPEQAWLRANDGDHVNIHISNGDLFVRRFANQSELQAWCRETERALAAEGAFVAA